MSSEGDKAAVFRTTKVRTKLRDDGCWMRKPQDEAEEEKPWIAEVRASRINGAPIETSTGSMPTSSTPPPTKSDAERAPTSGYLIRGVFTKMDNAAPSSPSNGFNAPTGPTQFTKRPSETYKRIAPHTVRPTSENLESKLSNEEQDKRTEAASKVLRPASSRQQSYVLSAAKKYETQEKAPAPAVVNSTTSFLAKRVEITDDDDSAATPAPVSTPPPSPTNPFTSVASTLAPKPRKMFSSKFKTSVDELAATEVEKITTDPIVTLEVEKVPTDPVVIPEVEKVTTDPVVIPEVEKVTTDPVVIPEVEKVTTDLVKDDPSPVSVTVKNPFEDMTPGCTKVDTPLPELILVDVQKVHADPELDDSDVSDIRLAQLVQTSQTLLSPTPHSPTAPSADLQSAVSEDTVTGIESEPEPEPEPTPSSGVDTLVTLSDSLISFGTTSTSFKEDAPELAEEEGGSVDSHTEDGVEQDPTPAFSNSEPITDDLLALDDGPETSAEPVPTSPGHWSQDLLSGVDSVTVPEKTSSTLDLLANDVIVINTEARSLSMQREPTQTDETTKEIQSLTETVTITAKTVIITENSEEDNPATWKSYKTSTVTESSSADPFDPYPIGTTSLNRTSDLLQPLTDISINRASTTYTEEKESSPEINMSSNALGSLADDIIPINTEATSLSTGRSWTRTWETSLPQHADTEESPKAQAGDHQTLVRFERKSSENDSPWDRWTSPTVYTITSREEEEEEESPADTQTQTVTTVTTVRETYSEPEPVMDRYETRTVIEEDHRVQTPEPETKKGFVYVKEYVNASELSLHNACDSFNSSSDGLTSSSIGYSDSSPSSYTSSSTCTYCGEQVGNDAKITIEHLNINCHPACFKCEVCSKPMGDFLHSMFLHGGKVHCESCYSTALD
ncbi:zinc finger protein 185 [Aulostomus maculatus]